MTPKMLDPEQQSQIEKVKAAFADADRKRIAALEAQLRETDDRLIKSSHRRAELVDMLRERDEQIAKAREALEPFAHFGRFCDPSQEDYDDHNRFASVHITCGMMRRAREVHDALATTPDARSCTCHPDDNPPDPCARKFALSECQEADARTEAGEEWTPDGLHEKAVKLWQLLDDIDTAEDIAKADDKLFREMVHKLHRKRFDVMPGEEWDRLRALAEPQEKL